LSSAAADAAEPGRPKNVFISYRRDDNGMTVAVLKKALSDRPDIANVFRDIDNIDYGDDFVAVIDKAIDAANVVLVIIGPRWLEMLSARLGSADWVRHEVVAALRLRATGLADPARAATRLHVVPVLIAGATPPPEAALPHELATLARLSMLSFDERSEQASINTLLERIQGETFEQKAKRLEAEAKKREEDARREADERVAESRRLTEERQQKDQDRKRRLGALLASAVAASALFLGNLFNALDVFNIDTRFAGATMLLASLAGRQEAPWSGDVVLVGIDERTEQSMKRKFGPSWRAEHAVLIGNAASAAARVVAFDLVLEDEGPKEANEALERALEATRDKMPVVFGVQRNAGDGNGVMLPQFASLVRKGINCAGMVLGQTGSMPLAVRRGASAASAASEGAADALTPAFGVAAFSGGGRIELVDDESTQTTMVQLRRQRRSQAISYYAAKTIDDPQPTCDVMAKGDRVYIQLIDPFTLPPLKTPPQRVAYENVVSADPATLALLKNRIVLVGALLPGIDMVPVPWPAEDRWGVELFAAQVDAMSRDFAISRIGPVAEFVLITAMALLGAFTVHRMRERSRTARTMVLLSIAVVFVLFAVGWYRFEQGLIGVPYDLLALALGAWLARNAMKRKPT
jgi:CHASE2 domain-containing sensor protein